MAMIMIHCRKESQKQVETLFEETLARIKSKLSQSSKIVHYLGNTNLLMGSGGAVQ